MAKTKKTQADNAAKELCQAVATAMLDKKAQNVASLDLSSIEGAIASYFVVCNADSTTQVDAIAGNVEDHVSKTLGQKPRRVEGLENSLWVLLDYVDVIVHVFQTEMREFYRIEQLWADAERELHTDEPPVVKKKVATVKKAAASKKTTTVKKAATAKKAEATPKKTAVKKNATATKTAAAKPATKKVATVKKVAKK